MAKVYDLTVYGEEDESDIIVNLEMETEEWFIGKEGALSNDVAFVGHLDDNQFDIIQTLLKDIGVSDNTYGVVLELVEWLNAKLAPQKEGT